MTTVKLQSNFHVLTIGWDHQLVNELVNPITKNSAHRFSHVVHPKYTTENWPQRPPQDGIHFFRDRLDQSMPPPDHDLLASLERPDVPTIHNMILGDRVLSRLTYNEALGYATFVARRLTELLHDIKPSVVILGFDAVHSSLALAVARKCDVAAFALNFSVIPSGLACFCDRMSPASRVIVSQQPAEALLLLAEASIRQFKRREIVAPAYLAPVPATLSGKLVQLQRRLWSVFQTIRRSRRKEYLKYTEERNSYNVLGAITFLARAARARKSILRFPALKSPPDTPYILFGLHMQPESSIDVWAPFYSDQMWVIKLLSRSIPPTHRLLVKIHKSDVSNYSKFQLSAMRALPGVELVTPFADSREFINEAALLITIQGTMGLEAALLGKPVIMLGDSPVTLLPSASKVGELSDLPALIRKKIAEAPPTHNEIVKGYADFLAPFLPASHNDWTIKKNQDEIEGYVTMFDALKLYLSTSDRVDLQTQRNEANQ